ncbi:hypothetical protein GCM10007320_09200 [Pseudorhodoferax aquiterrae]|uniref:Uncharacterized protein n=1 Tax=Pseudorhodoferax aquiterrae TaxID=747304 RepID=A0ABQ3FWI4_9BURK|nr:hypothetical protein [Pseudorhodoferax aquiterrae]GHC72955.1 hypothetical protein GCM10007320_09200 [Pseudorhodoferax aquiterrae]
MTDSEAIEKAQGVARCLTYNDDKPQAQAKHMLHELAHRLGAKTLRVKKTRDGFMLISAMGQCRYLGPREALLYRLFGVMPPMNPARPKAATPGGSHAT